MPLWTNTTPPKYLLKDPSFNKPATETTYPQLVIGISEEYASAVGGEGWVKMTIGQGGRSGRIQTELLVSSSSMVFTANSFFANTTTGDFEESPFG